MAKPPVGWARLTTTDPTITVLARLSDERPNVESGYGGWDEVERPRRNPITTYRSQPALRMTLGLLLDEWKTRTSVEDDIARFERMASPTARNGEPPRVRVESTGGAIPHQDKRWVVAGLSWGDALMNRKGNRVRQAVSLTLLEYVEDRYLREKSAANRNRNKPGPKGKPGAKSKRIVVKRSSKLPRGRPFAIRTDGVGELGVGEDLATLAARELGDAERWIEIAELNGLRDPQATRVGQVLRLP